MLFLRRSYRILYFDEREGRSQILGVTSSLFALLPGTVRRQSLARVFGCFWPETADCALRGSPCSSAITNIGLHIQQPYRSGSDLCCVVTVHSIYPVYESTPYCATVYSYTDILNPRMLYTHNRILTYGHILTNRAACPAYPPNTHNHLPSAIPIATSHSPTRQ